MGYWFAARNLVAAVNWHLAPLPLRLLVLASAGFETVHAGEGQASIAWLWGMPYLIPVGAHR